MQNNKILNKENLVLNNEELMLNETLFHNANGYLGVRGNFEEGYPVEYKSIRGTYINGFYDFVEMNQAEKLFGLTESRQTMLNIVDTQGINLNVDGESFSMFSGKVLESKRQLNMEKGITTREIRWKSPKGKEVIIKITRMASFTRLPLFTINYEVTALDNAKISISSTHKGDVKNYCDPTDPRLAAENPDFINIKDKIVTKGKLSLISSCTTSSNLAVTSCVGYVVASHPYSSYHIDDISLTFFADFDLKKDEKFTLIKYTTLCDNIRYTNHKDSALEFLANAMKEKINILYNEQEEYLLKYWNDCAINIEGNNELTQSVMFNLYQLLQSVGKDDHCNIAAKGLSGEGYEGHYFWDTEMYILPYFSLTRPKIARSLLLYRYGILEYAKENAAIMGHKKGVLFPWRTIMGKECSGFFPAGAAQYHINGDISYAVIQYYLVTNDLSFIKNYGAEIIFETARLWMDIGNFSGGQFNINDVTGPDEYTCIVNNNYYTNAIAKYNLYWAYKFYNILSSQNILSQVSDKIKLTKLEIDEFKKASDNMVLLYDKNLNINPQDDSFLQKKVWDIKNTPKEDLPLLLNYHPLHLYRHQVCKQADTVFAHFILEDYQSMDVMKASYEYYEKVTTHDSSLSTCVFSMMASRFGLTDKALKYFGESYKLDLFNTHKNTNVGIHTANMGGTYMTIVYGFGGLRIKEDGLHVAPMLPDSWTSYDFTIHYHDSTIKFTIAKIGLTIKLESGSEKEIYIFDKKEILRTSDEQIFVAIND